MFNILKEKKTFLKNVQKFYFNFYFYMYFSLLFSCVFFFLFLTYLAAKALSPKSLDH